MEFGPILTCFQASIAGLRMRGLPTSCALIELVLTVVGSQSALHNFKQRLEDPPNTLVSKA